MDVCDYCISKRQEFFYCNGSIHVPCNLFIGDSVKVEEKQQKNAVIRERETMIAIEKAKEKESDAGI